MVRPSATDVAVAASAHDVAVVPAIPLEGVAMGAATLAIVPGPLDEARQGRPAAVVATCPPALGAHKARFAILVEPLVAQPTGYAKAVPTVGRAQD